MSFVPYFLIATAAAVIATVVVRKVDARSRELEAVNSWFSDRMLLFPPQPLSPKDAAVVRSLMREDDDLWWHLNRNHEEETDGEDEETKALDREPYYQGVIEYGRYLRVLDAGSKPALFYGLFEDGDKIVFRVWIEFRHQGETTWVLSGDENNLKITRLSDFRVYYPGLTHRRFITFY